jgi:CMP-N-acetylneuraminic acid synthetase
LIIPSWRVRDIDEEKDWQEAELQYELMLKKYLSKF